MRRPVLAVSVSLLAFGLGCASITGLGKDYDFTDDAAAFDGGHDGSGDGTTGGDAGDATIGPDSAVCVADLAKFSNSAELSLDCKSCLVLHCCNIVTACFDDQQCRQNAGCEFACVNQGGNRRDCLNNCTQKTDNAFDAFSSCVQTNCSTGQTCANLIR